MSSLITQGLFGERLLTSSLRVQFTFYVWYATADGYFWQDDAFTKVLTLNLQRVFTLTQKCLPLLRAAAEQGGKSGNSYNDPGRIINVSSSA